MDSVRSAADGEVRRVRCGVCGALRPFDVVFCCACNRYDVWFERSANLSALRQFLLGTVLVAFFSIAVNHCVEARITDASERQGLADLRERLVRYVLRASSGIERCPTARGEHASASCVEWIRRLRSELREEIFSLDWTVPLRFPRAGEPLTSGEAEHALDLAADAASLHRREVDRLDERWAACQAREEVSVPTTMPPASCNDPGTLTCADVDSCRSLYAQFETYCVTWIACGAFQLEGGPRQASEDCRLVLNKRRFCGDRALDNNERLCRIAEELTKKKSEGLAKAAEAWFYKHCTNKEPHVD